MFSAGSVDVVGDPGALVDVFVGEVLENVVRVQWVVGDWRGSLVPYHGHGRGPGKGWGWSWSCSSAALRCRVQVGFVPSLDISENIRSDQNIDNTIRLIMKTSWKCRD